MLGQRLALAQPPPAQGRFHDDIRLKDRRDTRSEGTVRFSWGLDTTDEEIDSAVAALRGIAARRTSDDPAGVTA